MNFVKTGDHELHYREPGRLGWLFTVPLFAFLASLVVPIALGLVPNWGDLTSPFRLITFGGVLLLAWKANSWFGRLGFRVDASRDTLHREWGLFFPLFGRAYPLKQYSTLRVSGIRTTHTRNGAVAYTEDTWYLHLVKDKHRVLLGRAGSREELLSVAWQVADDADLKLIDDTLDPPQTLRVSRRAVKSLSAGAGLLLALLAAAHSQPTENDAPQNGVEAEPPSDDSAVRFDCPKCFKELEFGAEATGSTLRCPYCKGSVTVPGS